MPVLSVLAMLAAIAKWQGDTDMQVDKSETTDPVVRQVTFGDTWEPWADATHGAASAQWGCIGLICLPTHAATPNCTARMTFAVIITLGVSLG